MIKRNAIFRAIQFQRRLVQNILILFQLAIQFVSPAGKFFVFHFQRTERLRLLGFRGNRRL